MDEKRKNQRIRRYIAAVVMAWVYVLALAIQSYGAEEKVVSTMVADGYIYIYLRGISELGSGSSVQIGTTVCPLEDIAIGNMESLDIPMRTILLLDNSQSIPAANHEDIKELMIGIVAGAMDKEQLKIGTISDKLSYLCDYTSDKEALKGIIEGITYSDQETYLSDILYDVITELEKEHTYALTRIVIFADGADDKAIGYTNEEVRKLIEEGAYPVYAIGFPKRNNSSKLETLFSFSRAASSDYFLLDGSISNEDIVNGILQDQRNICVRIQPDDSLLDGSSKSIRLKLNTPDREVELITAVKMPFGNGNTEKAEIGETTEEETQPPKETEEETLPSLVPEESTEKTQEKEEEKTGGLFLWIVMAGVVVLIAVVALALMLVIRAKKERTRKAALEELKKEKEREKEQERERQAEDAVPGAGDNTIVEVKEESFDDARPLWEKKLYYLSLQNIDKPGVSYKVPIKEVIHIGRMGRDINITDDGTVSKAHCDIILRGEILYIKDVGSKNGTRYQNTLVSDETPMVNGGIVKIGKSHYRVELIKK